MDQLEYNLKRRQQNFDLLKFMLGTFILGLFAAIVNNSIQKTKLDLEAQKFESEHLHKFTDLFVGASNTKKRDFLFYMRHLSFSEERKSQYESLYQVVQAEIDTLAQLDEQLKTSLKREATLTTQKEEVSERFKTIDKKYKASQRKNIESTRLSASLKDSLQELQRQRASLESSLNLEKNKIISLESRIAKLEKSNENISVILQEPSKLEIRVVERGTGRPIRGANIKLVFLQSAKTFSVLTNDDGYSKFYLPHKVPPREGYELLVEKEGYGPFFIRGKLSRSLSENIVLVRLLRTELDFG